METSFDGSKCSLTDSSLGSLFQLIINDMKVRAIGEYANLFKFSSLYSSSYSLAGSQNSSPIWEDLILKASKLHASLR